MGGNLAIVMHNVTNFTALKLYILNTIIEQGYAVKGGGLYLSTSKQLCYVCQTQMLNRSPITIISIENVHFSSNEAEIVGGGLYLEQKNSPTASVTKQIIIKHCNFTSNYVTLPRHGGVALHSDEFMISGHYTQIAPQYQVEVSESLFYNNSHDGGWRQPGNSALLVNSNHYFALNNVSITGNGCSGIIAVSSNLILGGKVTLSHNLASSGGGMMLCQNAVLYLRQDTNVTIFKNRVLHAGGGISVETLCLQTRPRCFFQFNNVTAINNKTIMTINVSIFDNKAYYAGNNLFGGYVDYCYMIDNPEFTHPLFDNMEVYRRVFTISNDSYSVTSIPRHICYCVNGTYDCSIYSRNKTVYPGENFEIPVAVVGQLNGIIPGTVRVWTRSDVKITHYISYGEVVQKVSKSCTNLNYTFYTNLSHIPIKLGVENTGDISGYERSKKFYRSNFDVYFKDCPQGFELVPKRNSSTKYTCECVFKQQIKGILCSIEDKTITKENGNGWIGYSKNVIMFAKVCPFGYCEVGAVVFNVSFNDKQDKQCANSRTGLLCGKCKANYSVIFGSSACHKCSNKNITFIIVIALAGLILVAFLTLLNLTISEGTLGGLIFYANIIESTNFIPQDNDFPTSLLKTFIAWLNLKLGIPTCFYDGMDAYAKAWLQFAFPLYIWLIALTIILLSRKFQCFAKIASKNAVKVLATLILLSYATFVQSIIDVFSYAHLNVEVYHNRSIEFNNTIRWLLDANVEYFEVKHSVFLAFGLLCGLLCFPFTLLLLMVKPLQSVSHRSPFKFVHRLKPFIDAYTGPHTDNGRFWPGMLLLARIGLAITGNVNILNSYMFKPGIIVAALLILLGIASQVHPGLYRVKIFNTLECFFLWNLGVLAIISAYSVEKQSKIAFDVLVGSAFMVFIAILLYHLWLRIRGWHLFSSIRKSRAHFWLRCYPPNDEEHNPLLMHQ